MIEPLLSSEAFLQQVLSTRGERAGFRLWWLGQSGFLAQWAGHHLLLDPYLSESLTRKYAGTDKPHVRMTRLLVAPERLDFIDVVTSSHNHTDHLDADTLLPLRGANPRLVLVIPEANRAFVAERLRCDPDWPIGLDEGNEAEIAGFRIAALPAAHEQIDRDAQGRCHHLGYVVRFGDWSLYHAGDCVPYEGQVERLRPFGIDIALLPINGRAPERRVPGNFDGPEAARLASAIGARLVVPCHYEMFEFNTASTDGFAAEAASLEQPFRLLRCGERLVSDELPSRP
ncbi:MAG TPA: MBL fold metallo-hydrolase [Vicinamibacteria bacterium]|nr:MBL fold metallo-hydrolase [Vicinamibacteria bacterium]